ncbi:Ent-kaurene oxidase [Cytospora mali]|uniref:Ent-kaurene oxidase n=1 Tax=Cytospora mali TaxID=578113 RepID=A0A194V094_CYTMA|nr:Ent-kaurene oxidase [Valsa mali var. pyri (nom. inval.)]
MNQLLDRLLDQSMLTAVIIPLLCYYIYAKFIQNSHQVEYKRYELHSKDGIQSKWNSLDDVLRLNYHKDRNFIYQVEQPHKDIVVIPAKYVDELKNLPESKVNFLEDINERFLGEYNKMLAPGGLEDLTLTHAIKNDLTPKLGIIMQEMQEEISYAFEGTVGKCKDWTPVSPQAAVMRIIALVSGRIFVGPELNRNDIYLSNLVGFAVRTWMVTTSMRRYPKWLRPLAQYWNPEVGKVEEAIATMGNLLKPLIIGRGEMIGSHNDMLAWSMATCPQEHREDLRWQSMYQLQIGTASIHVTSTTVTHLWFDLAARPDYMRILRQEIEQLMATGGVLDKTSIPRLRKLDSFMKESMRINPFSVTGFSRKVMQDLTLSDGTILPKGITITTPVSQISMDPDIYPNPEIFDGLRFYKLREQPGNETRHQFVATNKDCLNWGHGPRACPGRFFANNEIKLIMAHLILNYDIKLPDGEMRPRNVWTEGAIVPDGTRQVLFRSRELRE